MVTVVDLGPRPAEVVAAIDAVLDVGPRRAAELVELLPAYLGSGPLHDVLREELVRLGATVEDREPPPTPPRHPTGDVSVSLVAPGADRVRVAKALRLATGLTFPEAKRLVGAAPAVVASGLSPDAAAQLRRDLEAAGATASSSPPS